MEKADFSNILMIFHYFLNNFGVAVMKSAARAASPEGFACRIKCIHRFGPPGGQIYVYCRNPYRKGCFLMIFVDFLAIGEPALAADWIMAWKSLPGRLR